MRYANKRSIVAPLCAIGACLPLAAFAQTPPQCPAGEELRVTGQIVSLSRDLNVPGSASGMYSGVNMRKGMEYRVTAAGSIRVGVFGETGTPPEGWVPQGPAGAGFPAPDAYTFSLLYRVGRSGPWYYMGNGTTVRVPSNGPETAELFFAINDTRTNDNTGGFNVNVKEVGKTLACVKIPPQVQTTPVFTGMYAAGGKAGSKRPPASAPKLPCEGKTPDGQRQGFTFGEYCPGVGGSTRPIPVEACTAQEARDLAEKLVAPYCHLADVK